MKFTSDEEYTQLREWTKDYINQRCIHRVLPGQQKIPGKTPGSKYTWIFYLRRGLFDHNFSFAISRMFYYKIAKEVGHFDFQIAGLETASTPLLTAIPIIGSGIGISLNAFSVRKEQKTYGLLNWIEGVPNTKPVMLIDDLCNSSASLKKAYNIINHHGMQVLHTAFKIVNKSNQQVHTEQRQNSDMYLPKEIKVVSLFNLDDFNLNNPSH